MTGEPKRIDDVLHSVDHLVLPIKDISFNPFNISKMNSWNIIMGDFDAAAQVSLGCGKFDFWTSVTI